MEMEAPKTTSIDYEYKCRVLTRENAELREENAILLDSLKIMAKILK